MLILGARAVRGQLRLRPAAAAYTANGVLDYSAVFQYSMLAGLVGAFILAVFFNPGVSNREPDFNQAEEDAPPMP